MDHIQLKCFISVARTLSFSEAARRNYVSQSTVSRYIRDLEKEFGVKLFERSRREVELTNEGKLLLPYIQDVIDTLNKATSVVSQLNNGRGGRLRLAYDSTSVEYPVRCLRSFTSKYPEIAVDMVRLSGSEFSSALNSSEYDFYFLLYMEIMDIFRTFHFSPDSVVEFDDVRSVYMAVNSGMGISILPSQLTKDYSSPGVKPLEFSGIETDLTYVLAWRKDNSNPAAHLFLNTVKHGFQEDEEEYVI